MAGFILPIIAGAAGVASAFIKPKSSQDTNQTTNTQQDTHSTVEGNSNQSVTANRQGQTANLHNLSPLQQSLVDRFTQGALDNANQSGDFTGYAANGLQNINDASSARDTALRNVLAARGLSYSPAAANAQIQGQSDRLGQQSQFLNSIPQLQQAQRERAQAGLVSAFSALPTDTSSTTNENTSGTQANTNFSSNNAQNNTSQNTEGHITQVGSVNPAAAVAGGLGGFGAATAAQGSGPGSLIDTISGLFGAGKTKGSTGSDLGGF